MPHIGRLTGVLTTALLFLAMDVAAVPRFVSPTGADTGDCSTMPAGECATIAYAVGQASSGDVVRVAAGKYTGLLYIAASTTLEISGGWASDFSSRNPLAFRSMLLDGVDVVAGAGSTVNVVIDGLTIAPQFQAASKTVGFVATGNGVLAASIVDSSIVKARSISVRGHDSSSVAFTLQNSTVKGNKESGILLGSYESSSVTGAFIGDTITSNRGAIGGGGVYGFTASEGSPRLHLSLEGCTVTKNRASADNPGGGLLAYAGSAGGTLTLSVRDSVFARNKAESSGGIGVSAAAGTNVTASIVNTVMQKNVARLAGGAVGVDGAGALIDLTLANTTLVANNGRQGAGGVHLTSRDTAELTGSLRNNVVWGNTSSVAGRDLRMVALAGGTLAVDAETNDIGEHAVDGAGVTYVPAGNISADPLVMKPTKDAHLTAASPCIDAGSCGDVPPADFEGDPRPTGAGCDIGADEFVP